MLFSAIPGSAAQAASRGAIYFVECGSDAQKNDVQKNDGRSADSPWTTLEQVNGHAIRRWGRGALQAGQRVPRNAVAEGQRFGPLHQFA